MNEPAIQLKNLLYQNWSASSPAKDNLTPESFDPSKVHLTIREYATNPQRIHNYQVSVHGGEARETPEEVGSLVMYKVEETIILDVWAIAGIGDDWETVQQRLRTMLEQVDLTIRLAATGLPGVQFIRLTPGWRPIQHPRSPLVLHRQKTVTAVYYRTETSLPSVPTIPLWDILGWTWDDGISQWS